MGAGETSGVYSTSKVEPAVTSNLQKPVRGMGRGERAAIFNQPGPLESRSDDLYLARLEASVTSLNHIIIINKLPETLKIIDICAIFDDQDEAAYTVGLLVVTGRQSDVVLLSGRVCYFFKIFSRLENHQESDDENDDVEFGIIPPNADVITDEEDIDENILNNESVVQYVAGTLELTTSQDEANATIVPPEAKRRKALGEGVESGKSNEHYVAECLAKKTVPQVFEDFCSEKLMDTVIERSEIYACQHNKLNFLLTKEEGKPFIGIQLLNGCHKLPHEMMYWEQVPDVGVPLVFNSMSKNRFQEIKRFIHLNDNSKIDRNDKLYNLRLYFEMLKQEFGKFGVFHSELSIDEMMESLDGRVINELTSIIPELEYPNYKLLFYNFFTSVYTLITLRKSKMKATVGEIRTNACPLIDSKRTAKGKERGFYDYMFDKENEILVVKWSDNKAAKKKEISVTTPHLVEEYNAHMGSIDLLDKQISLYRTRIRSKKWWWPLFTQMIDISVTENSDVLPIKGNRISTKTQRTTRKEIDGRMGDHRCMTRSRKSFHCAKCNVGVHDKCFASFHTE
ncbi:piggyBac transposable element-derived protein 2-like [Schistocerca gregaria]|uniref:piggyBac transposable element-derived protein 2-like n=1 Tax=Schistocerca gregaria TaxID=7010 RepID=UPI00211E96A3|nr:piggyBac transposable element-derived protein 2-like [Schistocerca gregaria]